jgi:hypothetical protein
LSDTLGTQPLQKQLPAKLGRSVSLSALFLSQLCTAAQLPAKPAAHCTRAVNTTASAFISLSEELYFSFAS